MLLFKSHLFVYVVTALVCGCTVVLWCPAAGGLCDLPVHFEALCLWEENANEQHSDSKFPSSRCKSDATLPQSG